MKPEDIDVRRLVRSLLAPGLREHHILPLVERFSAKVFTKVELAASPTMRSATILEAARIVAGDYERMLSEVEKLRAENARLRKTLERISAGSPPSDWEPYPGCGEYAGYGERDDPAYVDTPDESNGGDMHSHGYSVGFWSAAKIARAALDAKETT